MCRLPLESNGRHRFLIAKLISLVQDVNIFPLAALGIFLMVNHLG
jgi:hypothetical protein